MVRARHWMLAMLAWMTIYVAGCGSTARPPAAQADPQSSATGAEDSAPRAGVTVAVAVDRSALTDVGTAPGLDYSDPRKWLCGPGSDADECDRNLDATELLPDGTRKIVRHVKAEKPAFDCFYVYPTVKLDSAGPMTNFANSDIALDPLLSQGARFNRICKVYAPLYRQSGIIPGTERSAKPADFALGAGDVRDAFKYYVDHLSNGRKFVLIGHSQGTGMLMQLLAHDIDNAPALRERLISAVLIGGNFMVADGSDRGGTLANIPICTKPGQVGCVIAYESYSQEVPPTANARFGKASAGKHAACTEPTTLAGNSGRSKGSYIRLSRINPTFGADGLDKLPADITTPFVLYRDVIRGTCTSENGFSYLKIALETAPGDKRAPPAYHNAAIEGAGLGLHIVDYNLELEDLIEAVSQQAAVAVR